MKRFIAIFALFTLFLLVGCQQASPGASSPPDYSADPRLSAVDSAADAVFLRYPGVAARGIASGDPIAAECTEPGWAYIFYDDQAVIAYGPFPDNISVMQYAVALTVESHNLEFPDSQWDYINVPPIAPPPPVTSNDPVLGVWQVALCLDDGTIVEGPYTAEFDFNWVSFRTTIPYQLHEYNKNHDPDAHLVWGPDA